MKYIGKYADATAIQNALNNHTLGNPYIAFNVASNALDWNTLTDQNIPSNQIWYKTSDNNIIDIWAPGQWEGYIMWGGAIIQTNVYDTESGWCKATFDRNITSWGHNNKHSDFGEKTNLTHIILPPSLTRLDSDTSTWHGGKHTLCPAFRGCTNLQQIFIPYSLINFAGSCHFYQTGLLELKLPEGITNIPERFCEQSNISSITLPNSVTTINTSAFNECTSLTNIIIGENIQSIGNFAFGGNSNNRTVTIKTVVPPSIIANSFGANIGLTIYVPAASVNAYKAATNWDCYASAIQAIPE